MSRKKTKKRPKATSEKPAVISFRASEELVGRLDVYVEKLKREHPGGNWSRSSAALNLVAGALLNEQINEAFGD